MKNRDNIVLEVNKMEVVYHHVSTAVQGVSFKVSEGNLFAIIGANGAGKTTTLRAISGFLGSDNAVITDGEVKYKGKIFEIERESVKTARYLNKVEKLRKRRSDVNNTAHLQCGYR